MFAMTSFAASVSYDSRGQCALYFITDSRVTWGGPEKRWDSACKTFAAKNSADIFAFVGSAFLPLTLIPQVIQQLDMGSFSGPDISAEDRHSLIIDAFKRSLDGMNHSDSEGFNIIHGTRHDHGMAARFGFWNTTFDKSGNITSDDPETIYQGFSYIAKTLGSGGMIVRNSQRSEKLSEIKPTSRRAIHLFCADLQAGTDKKSGGPPQMVGLYRVRNAREFGFVWNNQKFISGMEVLQMEDWNIIDWRNSAFEVCDGESGERNPESKNHNLPVF